MQSFTLSGWHVRSSISLPELARWHGGDADSHITIDLGEQPAGFQQTRPSSVLMERGADACCVLRIPGVARYWIMQGQRVVIRPDEHASPDDVRYFLLGRTWELLCAQRGLLTLPGTCVQSDHGAIVLAGARGTGASTFAAALALRGHPVISDDFSALDACSSHTEDGKGVRVLATLARVKLWRESLAALNLSTEALRRTREQQERYFLQPGESSDGTVTAAAPAHPALANNDSPRLPVRLIILLERVMKPGGPPMLMEAREARTRLQQVWQGNYAGVDFGPDPRALDHLERTVERVPVYRFPLHGLFGFTHFKEELEYLERALQP